MPLKISLYKWFLTHPELDSNISETLTAQDDLINKHIDQTTFIEFIFKKNNNKKHLPRNQDQNLIQINEISQYQTNKNQPSETKLHEIRGKIRDLLLRFDQNKETFKSMQINFSIKEEIIKLKKSIATSENLHLYHQYLLKLRLNQFHKRIKDSLKQYMLKKKNKE